MLFLAIVYVVGNAATRSLKCSCVLDRRISVCGYLLTVYQVATSSPCVPLRIVLPAGRRPHGRALATAMRVERTRQGRTPDAAPVGPVSQASISEMGALPQAADVGVSPDFFRRLKKLFAASDLSKQPSACYWLFDSENPMSAVILRQVVRVDHVVDGDSFRDTDKGNVQFVEHLRQSRNVYVAAWVVSHHSELGSEVTVGELQRLWQLNRPIPCKGLLIGTHWLGGVAKEEPGFILRRIRQDKVSSLDRCDGCIDPRFVATKEFFDVVPVVERRSAPPTVFILKGGLQAREVAPAPVSLPPQVASLEVATRLELLRHLQRVLGGPGDTKPLDTCLEDFAAPAGLGTPKRFRLRIVIALREMESNGLLRIARTHSVANYLHWRVSLTAAGVA